MGAEGPPNVGPKDKKWIAGADVVEEELREVVAFLEHVKRRDCEVIVVDSNHDNALGRWLRETDYRRDPPNALFFLRCQTRMYEAIHEGEDNFHLVEWALRFVGADRMVRFLRQDESFVICRDKQGGIECGMHGHLGPRGAKGTPLALSKMGRKANTGHTHGTEIIDGMYVAGTCSNMDVGYNKGPSDWSHSHIVTYANGKRAIYTMWAGAWRAEE